MANIFMSLNTGVSGLNAAQVQISTTGNNIANADSTYYTRQRVVQTSAISLYNVEGGVGTGTQVETTVRIHDEFTYARLKSASSNLENTAFKQRIMQELAQNFPDLQDSGISRDMTNYFNAWNKFASNPNDSAQKLNLINMTSVFTKGISRTATKLDDLQAEVDRLMKINVEEVNKIGEQIANLNKEIRRVESGADSGIKVNANDLRDKRDELELALSKLINIDTFKSDLKSNTRVDSGITDEGRFYNLNIGGVSIVDGVNFHPLVMNKADSKGQFTGIFYEMQDGRLIKMEDKIYNGKIGAQLDLRGRHYDPLAQKFTEGSVQKYIDNLDTLAKTIIHNTNNIYAQSAVEISNTKEFDFLENDKTLMNFSKDVQNGTFDVIVYDNTGKEIAKKTIDVNGTTTMNDLTYGNSIMHDFNSNSDDNNDNNMSNDVNDYFEASYFYDKLSNKGTFAVIPKQTKGLYSIAFVDHGTNVPGVLGLNRFFDGERARDMAINSDFISDHTKLRAYSKPVSGNNDVANKMVQLQYDKLKFYSHGIAQDRDDTIDGYYRFLTTDIASDTEANNNFNETNTSLFKTAEQEFQSISGVDTNEELTNLIRFQASYGAAAKIVTTVNQMLETLLTLKQ
ncbi:flagellar hook-associated protein [Campylobacter pinnipediorum subsp. caledonicus]|uniref:flagellar hook-associated protein FlgK n=1 Tax=Campylobacter pinnipediorum TaxID=1965231 RepID=UPI0009953579|nr:flagellar hook-associated protein FlgK [Campylobacter pinnipediorum]AQW86268.1 flagellar hook-associated protein [Campylobacter pinnipediorum subsp. caledonicus]